MVCRKKITTEIYIDGMTCSHCAAAAEAALKNTDGIASAKVDLENKKAVVTSKEEINADAVKAAIDAAGFTVTDIVRK